MNCLIGRGAVLLIPLILLTACGSGQQRTTRLLEQRLQATLGPDVAAGRASVQNLPDGALVTLLTPSLFANDQKALDDANAPDVRANVIEGLLDPSLMRVSVADTSALPAYQRGTRVANVEQYFAVNGVGGVLVPADSIPPAVPAAAPPAGVSPAGTPPSAAAPAGLAITINVMCPPRDWRTGYGDGRSRPICD